MEINNKILELALKIRNEEHIPFDIILDDFMEAIEETWREYIFIELAAEFIPCDTVEKCKEQIKFLKDKIKFLKKI